MQGPLLQDSLSPISMDPNGCLPLLLGCLSVISWLVPLADSQGASSLRLTVSPPHSTFVPGERASLTCIPPEGQEPALFFFHEKTADGQWTTYAHQVYPILTMAVETHKTFACSFQGKDHRGWPFQSAQSNEVALSVAAFPPAPTLSLSPIYTQGAPVTLTCTAPAGQDVTGYKFYKIPTGREDPMELQDNENRNFLTFPVSEATAGNYTCGYMTLVSGRAVMSLQSADVVVRGPPPAPILSLEPSYPVYVEGEELTLTCSAPRAWDVAGYTFYQIQRGQGDQELPNSMTGPYQKITIGENTVRGYRCEYSVLLSGQQITSPRSSLVSLHMTGPLHPPRISVSPVQDVYIQGESVTLACSAPERRLVSEVRFFKDGGQLEVLHPSSLLGPLKSTHSLHLRPQDGGKYSCLYHIVESGRKIASRQSNSIWLSVKDISSTVQTPLTSVSTKRSTSSTSPLQSSPSQLAPITTRATTTHTRQHFQLHGSTASISSPSLSRVPCSTPTSTSSKSTTGPEITSALVPGPTSQPISPKEATGESLPLWIAIGCCGGGVLLLVGLICLHGRRCKENNRVVTRSYWKPLEFQQSRKRKRSMGSTGISLQEKKPKQFPPADENWGILPKRKTLTTKRGDPSKEYKDESMNSRAQFKCPEVDPTYTLLGFSCSTFAQEENRFAEEEAHIYCEPFQ